MPDLDTASLLRIRATRSSPPGYAAADPSRRSLYGAALQQFEELLDAARVVGPASRPLPLFYAVEQAGAAMVAAHLPDGGSLPTSHGLRFKIDDRDLLSAVVIPSSGVGGTFQAAVKAIGSPRLTRPAQVAELWSSLPESTGDPLPGNEHPTPLFLWPADQPATGLTFFRMTSWAQASVAGLPEDFGGATDRLKFLQAFLGRYPDAAGWESAVGDQLDVTRDPTYGWMVRLQWPVPHTGSADVRREHLLRNVASYSTSDQHGWLRPTIGDRHELPSPLMTWWALLYGLSMLARYYPADWTAMLDIDKSAVAATLETMLRDGLDAIPPLVLAALRTHPSGPTDGDSTASRMQG